MLRIAKVVHRSEEIIVELYQLLPSLLAALRELIVLQLMPAGVDETMTGIDGTLRILEGYVSVEYMPSWCRKGIQEALFGLVFLEELIQIDVRISAKERNGMD